jgi:hypothetical protein
LIIVVLVVRAELVEHSVEELSEHLEVLAALTATASTAQPTAVVEEPWVVEVGTRRFPQWTTGAASSA